MKMSTCAWIGAGLIMVGGNGCQQRAAKSTANNQSPRSPSPGKQKRSNARVRPVPTKATLSGVTITGPRHYRSHTHGGKAAVLHRVYFQLESHGKSAKLVRVLSVELLHAHCRTERWSRASQLTVSRMDLPGGESLKPGQPVQLRPGAKLRLDILVAPTAVYQACDQFGLRARFGVDGRTAWVEAPLRVTRRNPIRRLRPTRF